MISMVMLCCRKTVLLRCIVGDEDRETLWDFNRFDMKVKVYHVSASPLVSEDRKMPFYGETINFG